MKITQDSGDASYRIRGYAPGRVTVNDVSYATSLVLMPDTLITDWPPERFDELSRNHIEIVLTLDPEVILLGTGYQQRFPSRGLMRMVLERGVGMEVMNTASACRTYDILMAEGRRVAAALLLEQSASSPE